MLKTETAASSVSIRNPISDDDEDGKGKKTKTFAIPTALARWFDEQVFEDPSGVVKKEWLYNQYVKFCRERGNIRPKHKQIFSKLVFTVFPRAGSCRLGSIGSQVPYYFGIKRRKESNKMGEEQPQQRIFTSTETSFANSIHQPYPVQQTRSMLGVKDERSNLNRMSMSMLVEPKIEDAPNNKRKRDSIELTNEQQQQFISYKKAKPEEETTEKEVAPTPEENPTLSGECLKQRLLYLHRLLAPKEADPYQPDVESYVTMFVEQFWPELSPLQWDLSGSESLTLSEIEKNSFALCLCCSLFCGSLVKKDFTFAKETLMLCSQLVNSLAVVMNEESASERMSKNFGISLLFLARGLVDCSLFSNDMDAVILAKTYCAMAAEIFP